VAEDSCFLTIAEAARLISQGDLSVTDLIESVLRRIEATDDRLRAYTFVMRDEAHDAAEAVDREIAAGRYGGPLHGIPIALKDNIHARGGPTFAGSGFFGRIVSSYDSTVAQRLRQAGAIIIGKTETHEFAYNGAPPPTRNPWDLTRTPGGSSAGSAAAVAAHSCLGALGTETMGSIRMPAAVTGVVALKPTYGLVSRYGVVPLSWSMDHCGPMTKTVEDAALLLNAIAGFDQRDPTSGREPVPDYTVGLGQDLRGLRLGIPYYFFRGLHHAVRDAVEEALQVLADLGAVMVPVSLPPIIERSREIASGITVPEASAIHRQWLRAHAEEYQPGNRTRLEFGELTLGVQYIRAQQMRTLVKQAFRGTFLEHRLDALVGPMEPSTATLAEQSYTGTMWFDDIGEEPWMKSFVRLSVPSTLAGLPGLTMPCGFSAGSVSREDVGSGLPMAVQVVGRPFGEEVVLRIGAAYQRVTSWHSRRPPI
jgi:aspartyl-tRNA(Asn)/glutamyl-tRNA(Gln) amidotransferase subunit A